MKKLFLGSILLAFLFVFLAPSNTDAFTFTRPLTTNSIGTDVSELQYLLSKEGFFKGTISGNYGVLTTNGVRKLQEKLGLKPDGSFGPLTIAALNRKVAGAYADSYEKADETSDDELFGKLGPGLGIKLDKVLVVGGTNALQWAGTYRSYNDIHASYDMQSWATISPHNQNTTDKWSPRDKVNALYYDNKFWVIGGTDTDQNGGNILRNDVWSSPDGVRWTLVDANPPFQDYGEYKALVHNNKIYVLNGIVPGAGENQPMKVWSTTDGSNWSVETSSAPYGTRQGSVAVAFENKIFVLGGYHYTSSGTTLFYDAWASSDGRNWDRINTATGIQSQQARPLVYNGKIYLIGGWNLSNGGPSYNVYSSDDGAAWDVVNSNFWVDNSVADAVVANGKMWVGEWRYSQGEENHLYSSTDGVQWQQHNTSLPWSPRWGYRFVSNRNTQLSTNTDLTPRIAYWYGKVNQHVDDHGAWQTDPDGVSGADINELAYCQKWYPSTTSTQEYRKETITGWRERGNVGGPYTNTVMTTECVQGQSNASIMVTYPNGGEVMSLSDNLRPTWTTANTPPHIVALGANAYIVDLADPSRRYALGGGESSFGTRVMHDPTIISAPSIGQKNFKMLVEHNGIPGVSDMSDDTFTIEPEVCSNDFYQTMDTNRNLTNWGVVQTSTTPRMEIGEVTIKADCRDIMLNGAEVTVQMQNGVPHGFESIDALDSGRRIASDALTYYGTNPNGSISSVYLNFSRPYFIRKGSSKTITYRGVFDPVSSGSGFLLVRALYSVPSGSPISSSVHAGDEPYSANDATFTLDNR